MIKVTADSTCDLNPVILNEMEITLMPLHVIMGEKEYLDGVDILPPDIFKYAEQEGDVCKTAAANIYEYECFFKEFSLKYEAVIHVSLSSKFSSSFHNATLAAKKYKNVYVIDSLNLSGGSGIAVYEVALMAKKGIEPNEICFNMEGLVKSINGSFVIDRLDYLYKGGRCSGLESISTTLLKIKPTIEISNGRMVVGKKYRGSFERCLVKYVEDRLLSNHNIDISRIFITHPSCEKQTIAKVKEIIRYYVKFDEIIVSNTSCTVSSHCGPNTLGIFFKYKN